MKIIYTIFVVLIAVVALTLAVSVLPVSGKFKVFVVLSGSMEPAIKTGSVVLVYPKAQYQIGDVITFTESRGGVPITHRIKDVMLERGAPRFITKGDANEDEDLRRVTQNEIIGKVWVTVPYMGYPIEAAKKPLGFLAIIIVPALLVIIGEIKKIVGEVKKMRSKGGPSTGSGSIS